MLVGSLLAWSIGSGSALAQDDSAQALYQQGVIAYAEGDYERAANIWLIEAYEGSTDAQFNLGVLYLEGKGVGQSRDEAVFWFQKASENGHQEAQYNLGHLYLEDKDNIEDVRRGIDWWRRSADGGFPIAQYNYGRALFYGIGVDEDRETARRYLEQAAAAGDERSRQFLAEKFTGVAFDPVSEEAGDTPETVTEAEPEPLPETAGPPAGVAGGSVGESVASTLYVIATDEPVVAYTRFNTRAPIVGKISPGTLMRVMAIENDWVKVQSPGGVPGWVRETDVSVTGSVVQIEAGQATVYADPTESHPDNDIGQLGRGTRTLFLARTEGWVRILAPDQLPVWIETRLISQVQGERQDIEAEWQRQVVRQKQEALTAVTGETPEQVAPPDGTLPVPASFNEQIVPASEVGEGAKATTGSTALGAAPPISAGEALTASMTVDEFVQERDQPDPGLAPLPAVREAGFENLYRVTRSGAQMTSSPGADNIVLFRIGRGTLVDMVEEKDGWARVSIPGGLPVWVSATYLDVRGDRAVVTGNRVRARAAPGTHADNPVLGLLNEGLDLMLIQQASGWARVLAPDSVTAWISMADLGSVDNQAELEQAWREQESELLSQLRRRQ